MSNYSDRIIFSTALVFIIFSVFITYSGFILPRLIHYWIIHDTNTKDYVKAFLPLFKDFVILTVAWLGYWIIVKTTFFRYWKNLPSIVNWSLWITLSVMVIVVLERFLFHMPFNRWLIGPKHTILVTGLVITTFFLFLAYQLAKEKTNWRKVIFIYFLFVVLLLLQPDKGTTLLLTSVLIIGFLFKWKSRWSSYLLGAIFLLFSIIPIFGILNTQLLKVQLPESWGYVSVRINNWLDPFNDITGRSFQIANSLYALHKGGLFGEGYGFGVRKTYLGGTVHTDFVFGTIGEELGFVFASFIFLLTLLLLLRLVVISFRFQSGFEKYFTLFVAWETFLLAFVNAGMAANLLPTKGWPYPLISYAPFYVVFYIWQLAIIQAFIKRRFYEVF